MNLKKRIRRQLVHAAGHYARLTGWEDHKEYIRAAVTIAVVFDVPIPRSMRYLKEHYERTDPFFPS